MSGLIAMPEPGADLPPTKTASREDIREIVAKWDEVRKLRLETEKEAEKFKKLETLYSNWLISAFKDQGEDGIIVGNRIVGPTKGEVEAIENKHEFLEYIRQTGDVYLLECRVSQKAVREKKEAGEDIPGLKTVETFGLYNRKI